MTTLNLLEKQKNRLKQLEASLRIQERKQRTRRLIELGACFKSEARYLNANALLGELLFLKEKRR